MALRAKPRLEEQSIASRAARRSSASARHELHTAAVHGGEPRVQTARSFAARTASALEIARCVVSGRSAGRWVIALVDTGPEAGSAPQCGAQQTKYGWRGDEHGGARQHEYRQEIVRGIYIYSPGKVEGPARRWPRWVSACQASGAAQVATTIAVIHTSRAPMARPRRSIPTASTREIMARRGHHGVVIIKASAAQPSCCSVWSSRPRNGRRGPWRRGRRRGR